MKRIILFLVVIFGSFTLLAQSVVVDKELKSLIDAVLLLRQSDSNKRDEVIGKVTNLLTEDYHWTLMDELEDKNNGECSLTKKMGRFQLVTIQNQVLSSRYGANDSPGHFLNGEDSRFSYSLIEKGVKARSKVTYTFKGRVGEQDFVVLPYHSDSDLEVSLYKGGKRLSQSKRKEQDGGVYIHTKDSLKSTEEITLEIENLTDANMAIVILNYNSRK